jgi:Domain of unknown function (DUF6249)
MKDLVGLMAVVLIFGGMPTAVVLIYYFNRNAKHKERIALIEKGMDASIFMNEELPYFSALMWGMLTFGIGLGSFLGYILSIYTSMGQEYMIPSMSLMFGGLGLIGYYIHRKKGAAQTSR